MLVPDANRDTRKVKVYRWVCFGEMRCTAAPPEGHGIALGCSTNVKWQTKVAFPKWQRYKNRPFHLEKAFERGEAS